MSLNHSEAWSGFTKYSCHVITNKRAMSFGEEISGCHISSASNGCSSFQAVGFFFFFLQDLRKRSDTPDIWKDLSWVELLTKNLDSPGWWWIPPRHEWRGGDWQRWWDRPRDVEFSSCNLQFESLRDPILVEVTGDDAAISRCILASHPHHSHGPGSCLLLLLVMLLMPTYRGPTETQALKGTEKTQLPTEESCRLLPTAYGSRLPRCH